MRIGGGGTGKGNSRGCASDRGGCTRGSGEYMRVRALLPLHVRIAYFTVI